MPTYTYACTECGHEFDIRQSFTDDPLTDCPDCADGAGRLRKVIHPVGIAFKGSGFYKTDSRSSGGAKGSDGSGSSGGKDTGGGASETAASTSSESAGSSGSSGSAGSSSSGPASGASGSGGSSSGPGSGTKTAAS